MTRTQGRPTRDQIEGRVERFQHRWETDRQFRATWGSVIALTMVVVLCACVTLVGTTTNRVLAAAGILTGSSSSSSQVASSASTPLPGGSGANLNEQFPTPTSTSGTSAPMPPAVPIPTSQTPLPSPTAGPPTPTPSVEPTQPGGGGIYNGGQPACSGALGNGTWQLSPCPLVHGQGGSLIITDPGDAGKQVNVVLTYGQCPGNSDCGFLSTPTPSITLDGGGHLTLSLSVPANVQLGAAAVSGMINVSGGATTTFVSYAAK